MAVHTRDAHVCGTRQRDRDTHKHADDGEGRRRERREEEGEGAKQRAAQGDSPHTREFKTGEGGAGACPLASEPMSEKR